MAKKKDSSKYVRYVWLVAMAPLAMITLFFLYLIYFSDLPSLEELENPKSNLASEIISSDQKVLGKYYIENRTNVSFENLSPNLVHALVASEDIRFYNHSGVDLRALARSIKGVLLRSENAGGGSTISQQLAKLLFPREKQNRITIVLRKFKEWIIAVKLERNYTKDEIIAMYLNKFDFINNAVGIKSAARIYFNTTPDSLKIEQAAMLVGMVQNPTLFNPLRKPKNAIDRRNEVLNKMYKNDFIAKQQYDSLKKIKLKINFHPEDQNEGIATYFREFLRDYMKDWCAKNKKPDGTPYNIFKPSL